MEVWILNDRFPEFQNYIGLVFSQISEKYIVDGFLIFANVMVSIIKEGNWNENNGIDCYTKEFSPWESGAEVRRQALNVRLCYC